MFIHKQKEDSVCTLNGYLCKLKFLITFYIKNRIKHDLYIKKNNIVDTIYTYFICTKKVRDEEI